MKKSNFGLLVMLALCLGIFSVPALAADNTAQEMTIYALSSWAEPYLTIPDAYSQSVQLEEGGSYQLLSGSTVNISDDGLVTPKITTWYWYGSAGYTCRMSSQEPDYTTTSVEPGDNVIQVTADGKQYTVMVAVEDYAEAYADTVMDEYIQQNITQNMTVYEKVDRICQFAAGYDYSGSYSTAAEMIVCGGGDCWASTETIIEMCGKLGIHAWSRNASRDSGAGSGHRNALVESEQNGMYYEADAGFEGEAPRYYRIETRTSLYCYRRLSNDEIEVYQYDGEGDSVLEIPEQIDGYTVTSIGEKFLAQNSVIEEVILPNTITNIGDSAFNSCSSLKSIHLPASLENIGSYVFTCCNQLTDISCDPSSPYFCAEDGILYDKNKAKIIAAPGVSSVSIPQSVTEIGEYAFYYNINLHEIVLPANVEILGGGAFCRCSSLESVTFEGTISVIPYAAFAGCSSLQSVAVPEGTVSMESCAFRECVALTTVYLPESLMELGDQVFEQTNLTELHYAGNKEQWAGIKIGNLAIPENAMIYYNTVPHIGPCAIDVFDDITNTTDWYYDAVDYVYHAGIMIGTSETEFSPAMTFSRAQMVTVLYRLAGSPEVADMENPFSDVSTGDWYYSEVLWAYSLGITTGTGDGTTFSPEDPVTREQIITFLYRCTNDAEESIINLDGYADADQIDSWALEAVRWSVGCEIVKGTSDTTLSPCDTADRAETAQIMYNYLKVYLG